MIWKDMWYFKEERKKESALQVRQLKWHQPKLRPVKGIVVQLPEMSENSEQEGQKGKIEVGYSSIWCMGH